MVGEYAGYVLDYDGKLTLVAWMMTFCAEHSSNHFLQRLIDIVSYITNKGTEQEKYDTIM